MNIFSSTINYFRASYRELSKVSWPSRNEVIWLTLLVVIVIIIAAALLALIDYGLSSLVTYLVSRNAQI